MELVNRFCQTLTKEDFDQLSPEVKRMFYVVSIYCFTHRVGNTERCAKVQQYYPKLLFTAGIYGRKEMCQLIKTPPDRYISSSEKGLMKAFKANSLIEKFNVPRDSVYFYDDAIKIVDEMRKIGINAIFVQDGCLQPYHLAALIRSKLFDPNSVNMILLDFDRTLVLGKFKKQYLNSSIGEIINKSFGGIYRLQGLYKELKTLEKMGVKIGIITFNTVYVVDSVLKRIGWL